ncbi:hypothetical protein ACS0TY_010946 [Phlomoides rotata]
MEKKILGTILCFLVLGMLAEGDDSIAAKCSSVLEKVTPCLSFATAKAAAPTKDCCDSVTGLKQANPACLCFIIQQIHNGSNPAIKSLGVQESRLLQLPSACKLANASVAECPKLLNLPPNSPDALIFTNTSAATPVATSSTTPSSDAYSHQPRLTGYLTVAMAIYLHAFPTGFMPF